MTIMSKHIAVSIVSSLLALSLAGTEFVRNGDFESGKIAPWRLSKPNDKVTVEIVPDSGSPCGGTGALGITLSKERRIDLHQNVKIGPGKYKLTAYMDTSRCTKPSGYIMLYLSGSVNGKWHNFGCVATPGTARGGWKKTEWTKYEKIITVPEGGMIKSINITLISITGTVMLDGISLCDYSDDDAQKEQEQKQQAADQAAKLKTEQASAPQGMFKSLKYRNLFRHDETPELGFELKNPTAGEVSVPVKFTTTDYFGGKVAQTEKVFTLPANGKTSETLRYPDCRQPGFYCTNAEWKSGSIAGQAQASFVKVGPVPEKKDPLFGFNFSYDLSDNSIERLALMGAGSVGVQFRWTWWLHTKPESLEKIKTKLKKLSKLGIEPIGGFQSYHVQITKAYWNRWFAKGKPVSSKPTLQDIRGVLTDFVGKTVSVCQPEIRLWFLGGEVESFSQRDPTALPDYIEMIKFISDTIRRTDPGAEVQGIGIGGFKSSPFFAFMPKLLPYVKDHIDGIAPDIYPAGNRYGKGYMNLNTEENGFRSGMLKLSEMAKVTRKHYLSCAEGGPSIVRSTPLDDPCGARMGNTEARQYILMKTVPNMRHWLYFRADNWNPKSNIDWGMWEKENPRQVVSAYAATARVMAFAKFVRELPLHQDMPCWIFSKDGKYFAAIWYNGKENLKVALTPGIPAEAKDVQGNPIDIKDGSLLLGESPVYLYAKDSASLEKLLKNAAANVNELAFELERQQGGKTLLLVKNMSGHALELNLKSAEIGETGKRIIPYQDSFKLAAGEVKTVEKPIGAEKVSFHLETGKGRKYTASAILKPVPVPFVNSFEELEKKAVPQLLNDPVRQISGYDDLKVHGVYKGLDDLSGSFRLGYDQQYLYLEVRIRDDAHANNCVPGQIYNGDSIQFAFDTRRDAKMKLMRGIRGYSDDDFNFISALAKGKPITRCFVAPAGLRGKLLDKNYSITPEITRDEKTKTTLYRVRIAFEDLAPLKPEKGRNFGFSIAVFDRDPPSEFYNMKYSDGITHPFDPAKYPAFQFE